MPDSDECKKAREEYDRIAYRVRLRTSSFMWASLAKTSKTSEKRLKNAEERLKQAREDLNKAIDVLLEVCGERIIFIETDAGPPQQGFEIRVHPRISESDQKKVTDILETLPKKHKKGLKGISLKGKKKNEVKKIKGRTFITAGDYNTESKKINDYYPPNPHTIKHEIGHHVYYDILPKEKRTEWEQWWNQHKADMPTGYAKTKAREGWAEVYEHFYDKKKLDPKVKAKFEQLIGAIL